MSAFRFANPNWIHALWPVAVLVAMLFWSDWRRGDVISRLVSVTIQARLIQRLSRSRRWLSIGLFGLAAISLLVALMRPQWGLTYHETPRVGAQIMVCLDVSKSMLAEDTAPNRLERAKAELADLMTYLQGDQVGLIAFAGRAAVVCPLTPDFGFFRMILDGVDPESVGRGGTRLEEPIRKALDGFRTETDVSRIIVLITDGEDHDSHPLDAAKAAAERGIKILTIGFGDEAGSEIQYTDPRTGVRTTVRDSGGEPVVSRLDGETLRKIVMETEGAYIPAGTGALDLKSIYDAHIAPLVRGAQDTRGRAVRREGFQWAVLVGLVLLVASIAVGSRSVRSELQGPAAESAPTRPVQAGAAAILIALVMAGPGYGQSSAQQASPPAGVDAAATQSTAADPSKDSPDPKQRDPRELYNDALACLDKDLDRAEQFLTEARRESGTDGEVRFRATYNMGWVEVNRADATFKEKPEEALSHLRRAADWFRDAVRLRPDHGDARYNLELVLRRILELADSLAKTEEGDLTGQLDALIAQQRSLVATAREVVERISAIDDPNGADQYQGDFRQLAVEQRKLLSDSQAVSKTAREELSVLDGKSDEEKTPQDSLRGAQLGGVLQYTDRAEQRMGQARSQMRQRQADRAFRRASAALDELKRARDQLRGPVEVLDVILADAMSLAQWTSGKAAAARPAVVDRSQMAEAPAWLTGEYLEEEQVSVTQRTSELVAQLQAGLEQQASQPAGPPTPDQQQQRAQADRFLAMVRQAMPFLNKGKEAFELASQALTGQRWGEAAQRQVEAVTALREARERFLELRGLIELAYSREVQIQGLLAGLPSAREQQAAAPKEDGKEVTSEPVAPAEQPTASETTVPTEQPAPPAPVEQTPPTETPSPTETPAPAEKPAPSETPASAEKPAPTTETVAPEQPSPTEKSAAPEGPAPAEPPVRSEQPVPIEQQIAVLEIAGGLQRDNIDRGQRIAELVQSALSGLPEAPKDGAAPTGASQQDPAAQQATAQRQQLELAAQLIGLARDEMTAASGSLAKSTGRSDSAEKPAEESKAGETVDPKALESSREHVAQAVEHFQSLRRLFFSIVEHLRETAQRQAQLNDETEQVAALQDDEGVAKKLGPLSARQQELRTIAGEIADALREQAQQPPAAAMPGENVDPQQLAQLQQSQEQFGKAAKLVDEGGSEMESAHENLSSEKPIADQARKHQDQALEKLAEALALLQPPQPEDQNQQKPDQQQPEEQEQQQGEKDQQQPDKSEMGTDPARLLQAIRDREAQRNEQREKRARIQREPVEKDW